MDLITATDILSQIPASFYTQIESKKWSDRKEALDIIEKVTAVPRIQNNDLSELVRVLKKTIAKDSNIVVVTSATKCLYQLAHGLRGQFAPYASSCLCILFERFKEKKPNVISVIREAADAAFIGTNLEEIFEDVIKFLDNKNPQIKTEMALFLSRAFSNFPVQVRNKKILKPIINALMKTLSDMDATVRDNSAMALGTAMKVIGENLMMPLIADVEPIKITKIKEFCDKAEIVTAPVNGQNYVIAPELQAPVSNVQTNGVNDDVVDDEDQVYEMLEAVDVFSQIPASFYTQIESKKWSDRKEALEIIEKVTSVPKIQNNDFSELVRVLKKTVAKDSNIVVVTSATKCLYQLAHGLRGQFAPYASSCLSVLFERFKEKKPNVISVIREAADAAFIGTNLEEIFEDVIKFLDNKNPQIKTEMALFLSRAFSNFPVQVRNKKILKPLINAFIKTLSDMDATVRENSAMALGTAMKVIGENLMMPLIADVEQIKITKIKEFCERAQVKKIPNSVLNAMNSAATIPAINQQAPPPARSSSATMIRSSSSKKLPQKAAPKPISSGPPPTATVKRTATIIKRSTTVSKRASGLPPPPAFNAPLAPLQQQQQQQQQNMQQQQQHMQQQQQHMQQQQQHLQPPHLDQFPTSTPIKPVFATLQAPKYTKHDNPDLVIFRLISDNQDEVMESVGLLESSFSNGEGDLYKNRINQIIDLACIQLMRAGESQSILVKKLCDCLLVVFDRQQLITAASQNSIRFLLTQLFRLTQSNNMEETTIESLNNLASGVMDKFEPAKMIQILTGLLDERASIVEPVKKAVIRSMRSFS